MYVLVIPRTAFSPTEVVGPFGSAQAAESFAVELKLISWTACPLLSKDQARIVAATPGCKWVSDGV